MFALLEGEIFDVVKSPKNGQYYYTVAVKMPNGTIAILADVVDASGTHGGIFDNTQLIRRTSESTGKSITFHGTYEDEQTIGERVLVGFINGDARRPVILGGLKHPLSSNELDDSTKPQFMSQFLGMKFEINPKGNFSISHKGATEVKTGSKVPTYEAANQTDFSMTEDGSWSIYDSEDQGIEVNRTDKTLVISSGDNLIALDKNDNSLVISFDGDISVFSKKNTNIKVDGSVNLACEKDVIVKSKQAVTLDGSGGKLKLKGNKVALGSNTAELLSSFSEFLDAFTNAALNFVTTPGGPGVLEPKLVGKAIEINTKIKAITEKL